MTTKSDLEKENAILKLAIPLEDELAHKIADMHKYLAMGEGFTLNGIGRLLDECQRRMSADWIEIGTLRRTVKVLKERVARSERSE